MSVIDETWEAAGCTVRDAYSRTVIVMEAWTEQGAQCARLAAAAPEMARMLRDIQFSSYEMFGDDALPCCHWCEATPERPTHRSDCTWLTVMRKAGVLP